jgi:hypothetical protein
VSQCDPFFMSLIFLLLLYYTVCIIDYKKTNYISLFLLRSQVNFVVSKLASLCTIIIIKMLIRIFDEYENKRIKKWNKRLHYEDVTFLMVRTREGKWSAYTCITLLLFLLMTWYSGMNSLFGHKYIKKVNYKLNFYMLSVLIYSHYIIYILNINYFFSCIWNVKIQHCHILDYFHSGFGAYKMQDRYAVLYILL